MNKIDKLEAVLFTIIGLALTSFIVFAIYNAASSSNEQKANERLCQSQCGILLSQIINDVCHCRMGSGWLQSKPQATEK